MLASALSYSIQAYDITFVFRNPNYLFEIWLSPVIQATWEARAVGWFEVETPFQDFG
jgi:hypothetical protein